MRRLALLALALPSVASAQATPLRTRVALGPQVVPSYPGAKRVSLRPLIDLSRAHGDADFAFEAPDESFGFPLHRDSRLQVGPSLNLEGSRTARDVGAAVPKVGFTIEAGAFMQYQITPAFRLRAEARKGLGGHRGFVGSVGGDYVWRDRNRWLLSLGPRLTLADDRYTRAYFGVTPATAARTGLRAFGAAGGVQAVGLTGGAIRQISERWGVYGYARYDRLVADPARSPVVRQYGSRDQLSGGVALTYTFGR